MAKRRTKAEGTKAASTPVSAARFFALADELAGRDPEAFSQLFIRVVRKMPEVDKPGYEHVAACILLGTLQVSGVTGCFPDLRPKLVAGDPLAFRAALERFLERFECFLHQIAALAAQQWTPEAVAHPGAPSPERQYLM